MLSQADDWMSRAEWVRLHIGSVRVSVVARVSRIARIRLLW